MKSIHISIVAVLLLVASVSSMAAVPDACDVRVGPNVQVSDVRHIKEVSEDGAILVLEPTITVNPRNSRNFIVGGFAVTGIDPASLEAQQNGSPFATTARGYVTHDGGKTWSPQRWIFSDGQSVTGRSGTHFDTRFSPHGDAYLLRHRIPQDPREGVWDDGTLLFRSEDNGRTWRASDVRVGTLDGVVFGADQTIGASDKQIYMMTGVSPAPIPRGSSQAEAYAAMTGADAGVRLLTFDRGRLLHDVWVESRNSMARRLARSDASLDPSAIVVHRTTADVLVARSGNIYLPFQVGIREAGGVRRSTWVARSTDRGATISRSVEMRTHDGRPLITSLSTAFSSFALDGRPGEDRMYAFWADQDNGNWKLFFSSSSEGGEIWETPRVIEELANPRDIIMNSGSYYGRALSPMANVQVNNRGVILLSWYRFRDEAPEDEFGKIAHRRMVMASIDGGATFLSPRPLASQETRAFSPMFWGEEERQRRFPHPNGDLGHYVHIASDRKGTFQMIWLDGRTGHQEIWHAPVSIECNGRRARARFQQKESK